MSTPIFDLLLKPTLTGVTSAVGMCFIFDTTTSDSVTLPVIGNVNSLLATAIIAAFATWLGSLGEDYILPYLPNNSNYATLENKLLNPVLTGGLFCLLFYNNINNDALLKMFLLGAGSNILSSYEADMIKPYFT